MKRLVLILTAAIVCLAPSAATAQTGSSPPVATNDALLAFGIVHMGVTYEPGPGTSGVVVVDLFGPPPPEWPDRIQRIVWSIEPKRFDAIVVRWEGGQIALDHADLAAQLGPRPAGFDQSPVAPPLDLGGCWLCALDEDSEALLNTVATWLRAVAIALGVAIGLGVAIEMSRGRRSWTSVRAQVGPATSPTPDR